MRRSFHPELINGPFEDPTLYVRLDQARRSLLFDLGDLHKLTPADVLKVSDIFVTHMHLDHFVGFDYALRILLSRDKPLNIHGPEGIIECVAGRLMGYTWNLIEGYPIEIEVHEVSGGRLRRASFHAQRGFRRMDLGEGKFSGPLVDESRLRVRAIEMSHGIPSLAFRLEEDFHINIDRPALEAMGLGIGPWLGDLKDALHDNLPGDTMMGDGQHELPISELRKAVRITEGQRIVYIADTSPTMENIQKAIGLAEGATALYCEAYFMDEDRQRARERHHLTGALAGYIARASGVKQFVPMHFSPKYRGTEATPDQEAIEEYLGGTRGPAELLP